VTLYTEGFSRLSLCDRSIATGWSEVAGWASPTGRPCLCTAHFNSLLEQRIQLL